MRRGILQRARRGMAMFVNHTEQDTAPLPAPQAVMERRRAERQPRKFITQITPWSAGRSSVPFDVIIENISDRGIGLLHDQPMELGVPHLLTVPRGDHERPVMREYIVVRCDVRSDGNYSVGLELAQV